MEQVLKVTDLLLQGGGFGVVVLDLGDIPAECARRVPLTSWFRFRRAVEPTATVLLLIEQEPCAKTCASLVVRLQCAAICARGSAPCTGWQVPASSESGIPGNNAVSHAAVLRGMQLRAEILRSWLGRKPAQTEGVQFELRASG